MTPSRRPTQREEVTRAEKKTLKEASEWRITNANPPEMPIFTAKGEVSWLTHCRREVGRINASPGRHVFIETLPDGKIAVTASKTDSVMAHAVIARGNHITQRGKK